MTRGARRARDLLWVALARGRIRGQRIRERRHTWVPRNTHAEKPFGNSESAFARARERPHGRRGKKTRLREQAAAVMGIDAHGSEIAARPARGSVERRERLRSPR